ncbi:hypothetical protein TNCV_3450581 [Trichonephila clavipes]|uniref:Uncharacterized protein n=1 Tax=Trichonephila clavipes TaxID=2585209 RepID=A0A8X6WKD3_TRICX|nr:hypothetical protein TNCV_3450581 [Trichonephila clavipes]
MLDVSVSEATKKKASLFIAAFDIFIHARVYDVMVLADIGYTTRPSPSHADDKLAVKARQDEFKRGTAFRFSVLGIWLYERIFEAIPDQP